MSPFASVLQPPELVSQGFDAEVLPDSFARALAWVRSYSARCRSAAACASLIALSALSFGLISVPALTITPDMTSTAIAIQRLYKHADGTDEHNEMAYEIMASFSLKPHVISLPA